MTRNLSPALLARLEALDGCRGRWIVDTRAVDGDYSYALRALGDPWPTFEGGYWCQYEATGGTKGGCRRNSAEAAAFYCAATGWRCRLLWCSDWLNDDCSWPGGYDADSVIRSNARVFRDAFASELVRADGDADGVSLDVRFITPEMLETLQALEGYPLISEDDHSALELEDQQEAWESWAASEWRDLVRDALTGYAPVAVVDANQYGPSTAKFWADDVLDAIPDSELGPKLWELFNACADQVGEYWEEESGGQWIRLERVAAAIDCADLRDLTGLPLLPPDQLWRQEPYPWPGAEPAPLVPPLELVP